MTETAAAKKKRLARQRRGYRLKATYGITLEEYDALLAKQGGVCAGCGEKRRYLLHVDHDHAVEAKKGVRVSVRGLLCRRCNKLLRDSRDSGRLLRRLAWYLNNWPSKGVL